MSSLVCPAASVRFPSVPRRVGDARKGIANRRDCRSKFNNRTRLGRVIPVQASVSSETDAEASAEDTVVNHKLFAMGFCDDGDGGSWMGDDDSGVASGGHNVRVRPSLGGKIAAAFALGIAGQLAGAYSVRAAPKAAAAATATAHKPSPNLFTLPEGARKSLDDFVINRAKDVRGVMDAVDDNVNDPWDIEDVWLIIAWHFAIVKGRRKLYDYLKERDPENTVEWEKSFWNWLGGPMKVIGGLWIGMYLWDNGCRVGELLEMSAFLPATIMEQFDRGMYTLAGGIIAVMATDNYLPEILTNRLGVNDSSTKLVLTRLAVVTGALCTAISSALVFGLPPKSLLGFGGIGGLTFGLAAKDLVSNFIGGSMLAIMRPFSPGEKIYLMAVGGRFRGTNEPSVGGYLVKEIGWYQTTLIPKDTRPTTVPNGFFLGANVINISRQTARIIVANIRVRLDDAPAIPKMTEEITQYLTDHPGIINPPTRPIRVHCRDIKDDHLAIRVETHSNVVKKDPFLATQQELLLGMFEICKKHSTGPAWTVLQTIGEDNRPWLTEGESAK